MSNEGQECFKARTNREAQLSSNLALKSSGEAMEPSRLIQGCESSQRLLRSVITTAISALPQSIAPKVPYIPKQLFLYTPQPTRIQP